MLSYKSKYCLSFEPNLKAFVQLVRNIEIKNLDVVFSFRYCLSNKSGFKDFTKTDYHVINPLIDLNTPAGKNFGEIEGKTKVASNTFDNLITSLFQNKVNPEQKILVKIDVETKEFFVLKGAKNFLKLKIPMILCVECVESTQVKVNIILENSGFYRINKPFGDDGQNFFFSNKLNS